VLQYLNERIPQANKKFTTWSTTLTAELTWTTFNHKPKKDCETLINTACVRNPSHS